MMRLAKNVLTSRDRSPETNNEAETTIGEERRRVRILQQCVVAGSQPRVAENVAEIDADLAQRRFMLVDPNNRLVADTLEAEWNDKLRTLAQAREERERGRQQDQLRLDYAIRPRLVMMTKNFNELWNDPSTPNRERKPLLSCIIEDATLLKIPTEGITKIHVRFKGGKTETLTALNPKSSAQQVKTAPNARERILLEHTLHTGLQSIKTLAQIYRL